MPKLLFRPQGFEGVVEPLFGRAQYAITKALSRAQQVFSSRTLRLEKRALKAVAALLIELAEDLHCDVGIWRALERSHTELFGTELPFQSETTAAPSRDAICPARIQHFLWVLYPQVIPGLVLPPDQPDLVRLAQVAAEALQKQFAGLPQDSAVKHFVATPNKYGWDVKRKLVWLGTSSYLFRQFCRATFKMRTPGFLISTSSTTFFARYAPNGPGWGRSTSWRACSSFRPTGARSALLVRATQRRLQGALEQPADDPALEPDQRWRVPRSHEHAAAPVCARSVRSRQSGALEWGVVLVWTAENVREFGRGGDRATQARLSRQARHLLPVCSE